MLWRRVAPMPEARGGHCATLLADGRVLVSGGFHRADTSVGSCMIYDSAADCWEPAEPLHQARRDHSAVALPDGRVLVVGGVASREEDGPLDGQGYQSFRRHPARETELWNPRLSRWIRCAPLPEGHLDGCAIAVGAKVLVRGGHTRPASRGIRPSRSRSWDAESDSWKDESERERWAPGGVTISSPEGVIVIGGIGRDLRRGLTRVERWQPREGWTTLADLPQPRVGAGAIAEADGSLLVVGGCTGKAEDWQSAAIRLRTGSAAWESAGELVVHSPVRLIPASDGAVVAIASSHRPSRGAWTRVLEPLTGEWTDLNTLPGGWHKAFCVLDDGRLLCCGGVGSNRKLTNAAWLLDRGT